MPWCDGGRRLGPCRGAPGARVERPGQPAAASHPARACATCCLSRSGELALDLSLSVSRTDNARRVRDGYISLSACGHPWALATHAEGPICTTNVLANDRACRGRRFESVRGIHKRPANGLFCCLSSVHPSLERPSTCPQDLSPSSQEPWSLGLSKGF